MVSAVQAPGGCGGFVRKLQLSEGFARTQVSNIQPKKALDLSNFPRHCGFVAQGTRISERRRLCDAKTQLTIPGAQPSPSIRERFSAGC